MEPGFMQIGEVAERTGLTQRTIRFYEEKGILAPPTRMEGGFRLYSDTDVDRIRNLSQLRQLLCFSLEQIKALVDAESLLGSPAAGDADELRQAVEVMRTHGEQIEEKYNQLRDLRTQWKQRLSGYEARYGSSRTAPRPRSGK